MHVVRYSLLIEDKIYRILSMLRRASGRAVFQRTLPLQLQRSSPILEIFLILPNAVGANRQLPSPYPFTPSSINPYSRRSLRQHHEMQGMRNNYLLLDSPGKTGSQTQVTKNSLGSLLEQLTLPKKGRWILCHLGGSIFPYHRKTACPRKASSAGPVM